MRWGGDREYDDDDGGDSVRWGGDTEDDGDIIIINE